VKIEGTESKGVTEVLSSRERTLEHQLSHNAFVACICKCMYTYTKRATPYSTGRVKFSSFECNEVLSAILIFLDISCFKWQGLVTSIVKSELEVIQ
jgi:hypothetical protein